MLILNLNRPPFSYFLFFAKNGLIESCSSSKDLSECTISCPALTGTTPQTFDRLPFWNCCRYGIKNYGVEAIFNGMTSLLNFIKNYQLVQKLRGAETHRENGDLISLYFSFRKDSKLKMAGLGAIIPSTLRAKEFFERPWQQIQVFHKPCFRTERFVSVTGQ
jgi:hypothetical protein